MLRNEKTEKLLLSAYLGGTVNLAYQALKHLARTEFHEFGGSVGNHVLDSLGPAYRGCEPVR